MTNKLLALPKDHSEKRKKKKQFIGLQYFILNVSNRPNNVLSSIALIAGGLTVVRVYSNIPRVIRIPESRVSVTSSESATHAPPLPQASAPPPPTRNEKGGGGGTNSDNWRESLALCVLCGPDQHPRTLQYCKIWPVVLLLSSYQSKETACRMLVLLLAKSTFHRLLISMSVLLYHNL
jgi:hypothetical protein